MCVKSTNNGLIAAAIVLTAGLFAAYKLHRAGRGRDAIIMGLATGILTPTTGAFVCCGTCVKDNAETAIKTGKVVQENGADCFRLFFGCLMNPTQR